MGVPQFIMIACIVFNVRNNVQSYGVGGISKRVLIERTIGTACLVAILRWGGFWG